MKRQFKSGTSSVAKNGSKRLIPRILSCFIIITATTGFPSKAQEPLQHEKCIFRSDDGKLYINKDLPLYVRVATSPDEEAESWLLESEETEEYANPMFLDMEGWNSLRSPSAVDTATRETVVPIRDIVFDLYADGQAPSTSLKYGTTNFFENDDIIFFGDDINLEFDASDEMAGIEDVYYAINGSDFQSNSQEPLNITEEGEYELKFYAADNVGNTENPQTFSFTIDKTPPSTEHQVNGINNDKVLAPDATITLSCNDSLSGVKNIYYAIDDEDFRPYEDPIPVSVLKKTKGQITYYAEDNTGNKEDHNHIGTMASRNKETKEAEDGEEFDYYIDREPPEAKLSFEGDHYKNDQEYISERTRVVLEATDDKSGVQKILYSYNSFLTKEEYDGPFNPEGNSPVELTYTAVDKVDNTSEEKIHEFYIDRSAPQSDLSFEGPVFKNRDTTFISGRTEISINASDEESGVKHTLFSLNDQEAKSYDKAFVPEEKGANLIEWSATDNVNNEEEQQDHLFVVDKEGPAIHHHFSVDPIGEKVVRDEQYVIYPSNTKLYIGATDDVTGEESLQYTINDGKTAKTIPVTGFEPGNYEVEIEAVDALQNKTMKTIRFAIEK